MCVCTAPPPTQAPSPNEMPGTEKEFDAMAQEFHKTGYTLRVAQVNEQVSPPRVLLR